MYLEVMDDRLQMMKIEETHRCLQVAESVDVTIANGGTGSKGKCDLQNGHKRETHQTWQRELHPRLAPWSVQILLQGAM
jgi:hypothetical protein